MTNQEHTDRELTAHFMGMPVIVSPLLDDVPRMQLSPEARKVVTPQFAAEMDSWMLEFFGTESRCYVMHGKTICIGSRAYAELRYKLKKDMP